MHACVHICLPSRDKPSESDRGSERERGRVQRERDRGETEIHNGEGETEAVAERMKKTY